MLTAGDFAPDVLFQDQLGKNCSVFSQDLAGQTLFILLADPGLPGFGAYLSWLAGHVPSFEKFAVKVMVISTALSNDMIDIGPWDQFDLYQDSGGLFYQALGIADLANGPHAVVIDRNSRIVETLQIPDRNEMLRDAMAHCEREIRRYPRRAVATQAPVLLIPDILEPHECEKFIVHWALGDKRINETSSGLTTGNKPASNAEIKRRADVIVPEGNHPLNGLVTSRLKNRVLPEILKAYQFDVRAFDIIRIGCYDSKDNGFFKAHRDVLSSNPENPRKFALSLNLNDQYTGGSLMFPEYGAEIYSPPTGGGIVFSCSLLHEALPVESGQRFGIFLFLN